MAQLPDYAKGADPSRLVKLLCKGKCSRVRWAEMNQPYPGKTEMRKAEMGVYTATCLYCGKIAYDNYNWMR
jgi:hypothetical protein